MIDNNLIGQLQIPHIIVNQPNFMYGDRTICCQNQHFSDIASINKALGGCVIAIYSLNSGFNSFGEIIVMRFATLYTELATIAKEDVQKIAKKEINLGKDLILNTIDAMEI